MASFIPENIIEEILGRVDIVELISSYFPVKKVGRNFKATCPFHKEKTPSFIISQDKQIFHCFGCGEGGNVIHFLMKYERLEFPEAVRSLAKRAGITVPEEKKETRSSLGLFKINELAMQFYQKIFLSSEQGQVARQYINKRNLSDETISGFGLGFAPNNGTALVDFLRQKGIDFEEAKRSGLIMRRQGREGYFDFFRGRLVYPIFDIRGRVMGFGGRVLDSSLPKYINTPETSVYKKGEILYGLNLSRDAIREKKFVIIVEGYMDLISLFQAGFNNVVATSGTALTIEQARLIKRFSPSVVVVYDGDKAGELASLRGLEILLEAGLDVKLITLPIGFDPDKFIHTKGRDEFNNVLNKAENLFEYKLNILSRNFNIDNLDGKLEVIKEMLPTLARIENMVLRSEFVKQLASRLKVAEESVWLEFKKISHGPRIRIGITKKEETKAPVLLCNTVREAETMLLKLMLEEKSFIKKVKKTLSENDFLSPQVRKVVNLLYTFDNEGKAFEPSRIVNSMEDNSTNQVVTKLLLGDALENNCDIVFDDCIKKIKEDNRRRFCHILKDEIAVEQKKGNFQRVGELLKEFNASVKQKI